MQFSPGDNTPILHSYNKGHGLGINREDSISLTRQHYFVTFRINTKLLTKLPMAPA